MFDWEKDSVLAKGPKRVAAIMAHPDDADFTCAATCARWIAEGHHVTYVIMTNGDKGSDDRELPGYQLVATREREQRDACAILGVHECIFLGYEDGYLQPTLGLRRDLVRVIRHIRPDVVICSSPTGYFFGESYLNHPDHRAGAIAVLEALFPAARNHRFFPELLAEGLEPYRTAEVWISEPDGVDTYVDVTSSIDKKIEALRAHASQMGDWDPEEMVKHWAAEGGKKAEPPVAYAEDYKVMRIGGEEDGAAEKQAAGDEQLLVDVESVGT